ncbi:hypothetical protein J7T55_004366 [Diaporthe amygdali]|uniref:uncharacterized protein n=1 Tax=Phomopsis amygdali TaxID=1214568 RepID=UPI0022FDB923|nr:uncharacterized protein J7T55_004366 [Diaporthe amygdali]KAJ0109816.1 hypothetical protein J7T55_004366 [Diaporthe amygdali]
MKTTLGRVGRLHKPSWSAFQIRRHSSQPFIQQVAAVETSHGSIDVSRFRELAFDAGKPLLMKRSHEGPTRMPAIEKWFQPVADDHTSSFTEVVSSYFQGFSMASMPYELMYPQLHEGTGEVVRQFINFLDSGSRDTTRTTVEQALADHLRQQLLFVDMQPQGALEQRLLRFEAPLALLLAALRYNAKAEEPSRMRQLYIAQCSLPDLPGDLAQDLPAPRIVKEAGKGDIYASSIWLGLEPTYTPLHRDPNPNVFVQLRSSKTVRLLPPQDGDTVFRHVQARLGRWGGSSRIRGTEMMEGPEREMLHHSVWKEPEVALQEAHLGSGDALFIPKGWWHSVKSHSSDGRLNGSVNWWFR